jgi:methyl-accepting chemotaxis protein
MRSSQNKKGNALKPEHVISKGFTKRLLLLILGVFIFFTVLSAAYMYLDLYRPLGTHYSAIVTIISGLHETLAEKTLKINAFSFFLIFAGIMILGVMYTHRIVGPLHRVRMFAGLVAGGKLNAEMTFRKKDAIQPFKDSFNRMTEKHSSRLTVISSEVRELKESLAVLKSLAGEGKDTEHEIKKILDRNESIRRLLSEINL